MKLNKLLLFIAIIFGCLKLWFICLEYKQKELSIKLFKPFDKDNLEPSEMYLSKKGYDCFIFDVDTVRLIITNKKLKPFESVQDFGFVFVGMSGKILIYSDEVDSGVYDKCKLIMDRFYPKFER